MALWKQLGSQTAGILKASNQGSILSASPRNPGCRYLQSPARLPFQGLDSGILLPASVFVFLLMSHEPPSLADFSP